jgi:putative hydrolase, CocE/NonD family
VKRSDHSARLLAVFVAALSLSGCATLVGYFVLPKESIREPQYQVNIDRDVTFNTSDAVPLVADIYRPRTEEKTPTILVRIPFTKTFKNSLAADVVGRFWASRGYTVVIQGTRGRYKSGGSFYPLQPERQDGIETLQWLSRQPWFDGRLGMWGGSAFGHTQWVLADQSQPGATAA